MDNFAGKKQQILEALNGKNILGIDEPVMLVDGFVNLPLCEIKGAICLPTVCVPSIVLIGKKSGQVYLYAYNALIKKEQQ